MRVLFCNGYTLSTLAPFGSGKKCIPGWNTRTSVFLAEGIVYDIPLDCRFRYKGQSGWCVKVRSSAHKRNVKHNEMRLQLVRHLSNCNNCFPEWHKTAILDSDKDSKNGLLKETLCIGSVGNCASHSSILLSSSVSRFLRV